MLDTRARRWVDPVIDRVARAAQRLGFSANGVTLLATGIGLAAALLVHQGAATAGVALLWISGLLDAADGALARMTESSPLGAILDITSDRIVELAVIVALALRYPELQLPLLVLCAVIAVAMSLFLAIAAALENHSHKSFHYAPGLGERTEAFICLSLMVLDAERLLLWSLVFIAVIVFTMGQRLLHARRALAG